MAKRSKTTIPPVTPGEILREEFMTPYGLSSNKLGLALRVSPNRISEIVNAKRAITPETAIRLGRYFNTSARFWLNLQSSYDLEVAQDRVYPKVERDVQPIVAAAAKPCA